MIQKYKDKSELLLRNDLVKLVGCSKEWLMLFNVEKCKVVHIGVVMKLHKCLIRP
jgi:hypothetical protein